MPISPTIRLLSLTTHHVVQKSMRSPRHTLKSPSYSIRVTWSTHSAGSVTLADVTMAKAWDHTFKSYQQYCSVVESLEEFPQEAKEKGHREPSESMSTSDSGQETLLNTIAKRIPQSTFAWTMPDVPNDNSTSGFWRRMMEEDLELRTRA